MFTTCFLLLFVSFSSGAPGPLTSPLTGALTADQPRPAHDLQLEPPATEGESLEQDEEEIPDKRPEIEELLGRLAQHVKKRGEQDREAIEIIDLLLQEFPQSGPKDRKDITKGLSKCFQVKRKTLEGGIRDNRLFIAAAAALGEMGPESCKELITWLDHKSHRKDLVLQRRLVRSMGKTQDDSCIKPLKSLLNHKEPGLIGAAAEALGQYDSKPEKIRKDIFEAMLKVMMAAKGQVDADVNDNIARDRWESIRYALIPSLQKLAGQEIRDPDEWQRWWNKNKRDNWDEMG